MNAQTREVWLHRLMSMAGGVLGVYSIFAFCQFFGSAQTANLIYIVTALLGGDWLGVLLRVGGALLFAAAIALTSLLMKRHGTGLRLSSILIDALAIVILALLPSDINPVLGMYPLFFATAFQWNCFPGAKGFASSSIFSTNNFRQFVMAGTQALVRHDDSQREKMAFFGFTLLFFHLGVALGTLAWTLFDRTAVLIGLLPLVFAWGVALTETVPVRRMVIRVRWKIIRPLRQKHAD